MKHAPDLHTEAVRLVGECSSPTPIGLVQTGQLVRQSDGSYMPACLMTWRTQVEAMDDTIGGVKG